MENLRELFKNHSLKQNILDPLPLLKSHFSKIKDPRSCPTYPLPQVLTEIIKALMANAKSLQDIQHMMEIENFFEIRCADSCLGKIISQIPETEVKHLSEILWEQYNVCEKEGLTHVYLSNGQKIHVRHFDGTYFLNHFFCYVVSGGTVNPILGLKVCSNIGEEFSTTKELDEEISQLDMQLQIKPFHTLSTYDGKYFSYEFLQKKHEKNEGFLVRIREDDARDLEVIQFLNTFRKNKNPYMRKGVMDPYEGIDHVRKIKYTISYTYDKPGKLGFWVIIAHIQKEKILSSSLKDKQKDDDIGGKELYVITNLVNLHPRDIYELSMSHWEVETAFKNLKEEFVSSRTRMKYPVAALIWAFLIAIAYNIVKLFSYKLHLKIAGKLKLTLRQVRNFLRRMISSMRRTLNKVLYDKAKPEKVAESLCLSAAGA